MFRCDLLPRIQSHALFAGNFQDLRDRRFASGSSCADRHAARNVGLRSPKRRTKFTPFVEGGWAHKSRVSACRHSHLRSNNPVQAHSCSAAIYKPEYNPSSRWLQTSVLRRPVRLQTSVLHRASCSGLDAHSGYTWHSLAVGGVPPLRSLARSACSRAATRKVHQVCMLA